MSDEVISSEESLKKVLAHIPVLIKKSVTPSFLLSKSSTASPATNSQTSSTSQNTVDRTTFKHNSNMSATLTSGLYLDNNQLLSTEELTLGNFSWFREYFPGHLLTTKTYETYLVLAKTCHDSCL
jgi:hypothetical protein